MRILLLILTLLPIGPAVPRSLAAPDAPAPSAKIQAIAPQSFWPGKQPDGSVRLPNQWLLRPVGKQVALDDFPVNIAVHPGGQFAAVLHAGYGRHEIAIVDVLSQRVASKTPLHETFYGVEFSPDGKTLYCSGAGDEVIHAYKFDHGQLGDPVQIKLRGPEQTGVPCGLAIDARNKRLFVANVWGHSITRIDLGATPKLTEIFLQAIGKEAGSARLQPSADPNTAAATKRAQAALLESSTQDAFPYACRLDEKRERLYVSLWAQSAVAVVDLNSNRVCARWPTEEHPCEMALTRSGRFLFVANANRNTVTVFDTETGAAIETIWAAFFPQSPPGATPNSLALSPDERTLFVANANVNAVAVFDVAAPGKSRSLGFIPVGWYPTSVRVTPDGKTLLVSNGKGIVPLANPHGPQPIPGGESTPEYIGGLLRGTLSIIELPRASKVASQMAAWTADAYRCAPLRADSGISSPRPANNPIPARVEDRGPIHYCIYVIKENRTYDQVFGDMRRGNGDPNLCLFPESVTPNHHKLARDFVLLDNFYAEAEVSADGHEWSMGAYATDFVEKTWPLNYGHSKSGKFPYPSEGDLAIAAPAGGYLWDRAREAGVSYRSYGEFVNNGKKEGDPAWTKIKSLRGHFDEWFRTFDLDYSDLKRADRFISELKRFERAGEMPRLQIVRLPNDHTHGTTAHFPTPTAYVAENDLALGRVVEAISHSMFWPETAIFVVEDDAQNGPDHVDAHRTVALVVSPYAKRGYVDSTLYSTTSMLRSMELILGLKPMTQFDAAAAPMFGSFQPGRDARPFDCLPAKVDLGEKNMASAWGSTIKMNFAREDAVDDLLLNKVIWRSVRGADAPAPAPVRAAFVRAGTKQDDDD
jgi:DNA-binding beta-propeller fold protein YncE